MNVHSVNDAPVARDDRYTTPRGTYIDNGGTLQFYPAAGFVGTATFTYTVVDGKGATATARVTVNVT